MEDLNCVNRAVAVSFCAAGRVGRVLLAGLLAALAACSGSGSGGSSQGATVPTAIATPVGYQGTGTNPVAITVRSGADVALTAAHRDCHGVRPRSLVADR